MVDLYEGSQVVSDTPGTFDLSWHPDYGYRVSVPELLGRDERLTVIEKAAYDAAVGRAERAEVALDEAVELLRKWRSNRIYYELWKDREAFLATQEKP